MAQRSIKILLSFAFHRKLIDFIFFFFFLENTPLLYLSVSSARLSVILARGVKRFDTVTKKLTPTYINITKSAEE